MGLFGLGFASGVSDYSGQKSYAKVKQTPLIKERLTPGAIPRFLIPEPLKTEGIVLTGFSGFAPGKSVSGYYPGPGSITGEIGFDYDPVLMFTGVRSRKKKYPILSALEVLQL